MFAGTGYNIVYSTELSASYSADPVRNHSTINHTFSFCFQVPYPVERVVEKVVKVPYPVERRVTVCPRGLRACVHVFFT